MPAVRTQARPAVALVPIDHVNPYGSNRIDRHDIVQREHHTVWVLWGSKYLYSVFWVLEWHVVVSLILSSCLRAL
jgi:hypothetical protein